MSVSVKYENPMLYMWLLEHNRLEPAYTMPEGEDGWRNRIDMGGGDCYKANGAVWVCDIEQFKENPEWYQQEMAGYEMPLDRGLDVDTMLDFLLVEKLMERRSR